METKSGYKTKYEQKNQRLDVRLNTSMIQIKTNKKRDWYQYLGNHQGIGKTIIAGNR
jgi:hypothetical protein